MTVATSSTVKTWFALTAPGAPGFVGVAPAVGLVGNDGVCAVGRAETVLAPISGSFLKSSKVATALPTSIEIEPLSSSIDPAGKTKPLA